MSAVLKPVPQPTFDEAMALLRGSVTLSVRECSAAELDRLLKRDAAAEACNEVDE